MPLQVFELALIFSTLLRVLNFFTLQVHWKLLYHLIHIYIVDYSEHTLDFAINFYLLYYVLSSICIRLDKLPVAIIFFVLNYIAYVAVILPWRN